MTETNHISVDKIRVDGGTQMRAAINEETVKEYTERYLAGERMPALVVFYDGSAYWLADGFHRHRALVDSATPQALCEIRRGDRRDAVIYACGANASHGLRRTNADKRRSVEAMLRDEEWSQWTDRRIASVCGVGNRFVSDMRAEAVVFGTQLGKPTTPTTRTGTDGKNYPAQRQKPAQREEAPKPAPSPLPPAPLAAIPPPPVAPAARPVERVFPMVNTAPTREAQEADSAALAVCGFMDRATMALGEQSYHIAGYLLSEDRAGKLNISISQLEAAISELKANLGAQQ
jgi:hypothetical protein